MKSFLSIQILCLLLLSSFNGLVVDARIGNNNNKNAAIPRKPAIKIGSEQQQQQQHDEQHRSLLSNVVENLKSELPSLIESIHHASFNTHRAFGGGPTSSRDKSSLSSSRSLEQAWARDNNGDILWWIWLIIALGIALCFCLCCCTSVCCLRD